MQMVLDTFIVAFYFTKNTRTDVINNYTRQVKQLFLSLLSHKIFAYDQSNSPITSSAPFF
ncbi:hypothetical protein C8C85_2488 [Flavobacterium sp. 103]|nr:hypothetical protein C8C85_2488 [Flavobacterium sp. 103]